jgi:restriction endonuclease Mrr
MTIPSASELSTPLLNLLSDQKEHSLDEVRESLAKTVTMTDYKIVLLALALIND